MGENKPRLSEEAQLRIRETAYLMWEAAGCQHGRSLEYWLAAERELIAFFDGEPERGIADDRQPPLMAPLSPPRWASVVAEKDEEVEGKEGAVAAAKSASRSRRGSRGS
jgi:hypothetical protein